MSHSLQKRSTVFISYSHKDRKLLERLQVHLKPLERSGRIERWDDTKIKTGANWRSEIEQAIARAKVAVLLISADFLASDFIHSNELPPLLEAAQNEGAIILPVIIKPSRFTTTPSLSKFQAFNDPQKPFSGMTPTIREECFVQLTSQIENALNSVSQVIEHEGTREGLLALAKEIVSAFEARDLEKIIGKVHPKGLRFSPYAYIEDDHLVFKPTELEGLLSSLEVYRWGVEDGSGLPIELTFKGYYENFIYDAYFVHPYQVSFNKVVGRSNTNFNIEDFYPSSNFVEFYVKGFAPKFEGMDWRSLRLIFEEDNQHWYLVAVVHDEWTP